MAFIVLPSQIINYTISDYKLTESLGRLRKPQVLRGGGGHFIVTPNPRARAEQPKHAEHGRSRVLLLSDEIELSAKVNAVDADLIRAIMYVETTQGGRYGEYAEAINMAKSILPMNINVKYWGDVWGTKEALKDPLTNVLAGGRMLRHIIGNMPPGASVAQIASVYNVLGAHGVTDYGARVQQVYDKKLWER